MPYLLYRILISLTLSLVLTVPGYSEPQNLSFLKDKLITYHNSGQYQREIEQVINRAQYHIARATSRPHQEKLALVLDIDETSLSNYDHIVRYDFSGERSLVQKGIFAANSPAIKPTLALYNYALGHGVSVFFITGRRESMRSVTQLNLKRAGFKNWTGLYFRPENYNQPSVIPFKSGMRQAISKQGYLIIASIGDQNSDLLGGYAQKGYKLPNPFYYLP